MPVMLINLFEVPAGREARRAAHDEGFRKLVGQPQWRELPSTPALYEVVHTG